MNGAQRTGGCVNEIATVDVDAVRSAPDHHLVLARPEIENGHHGVVHVSRRGQDREQHASTIR
jgi:hypothetical protein